VKGLLAVWSLVTVVGITAHAQQLSPATPLQRDTLAVPGQPTTAPPGWTLRPSDAATAPSPDWVARYGPGVRIAAADELALFRPAFPLTGDGAISAVVFVDAATPPVYGLTLGGENGLAFLVRGAGAVAIAPLRDRKVAAITWTSVPTVRTASTSGLLPQRVEVRVRGALAELIVNGTVVLTRTITAGALDGVPGVYSNGTGDLVVAGFSVRTVQRPLTGTPK
jgi:hypothetical protein